MTQRAPQQSYQRPAPLLTTISSVPPEPLTHDPRGHRFRPWIVLATAAFLLAGCADVVGGTAQVDADATFTAFGTHTLYATPTSFISEGAGCEGKNGYNDIQEGVPVTLYDQGGDIVGGSALESGVYNGAGACLFTFTIHDVPFRAFYEYEVGDRGRLPASLDEVRAGLSSFLGDEDGG